MHVVRVLPLTKVPLGELTFFGKEVEAGMVVTVTIRGREVPALVIDSRDAREEKAAIRGQGFALKKLALKGAVRVFSPALVKSLESVARYHATGLGAVLMSIAPAAVLAGGAPVETLPEDPQVGAPPERLTLQAEYEERMRTYRNLTREAFARGQSVMLVAASVAEAEALRDKLSRGIDEQVLLATSALSKKATLAAWQRAAEDPEPLLIIATPTFLALPRANLSTTIIERESARAFVMRERPNLDLRLVVEAVARSRGARLLYADFPLRVETRAALAEGGLEEFERSQVQIRGGAGVRIIDMRPPSSAKATEGKARKRFSPISDYAREAIGRTLKEGGRVFVYAARKGLAPLTVCHDCGTPVTDAITGTPMVLNKTTEGNVFISPHSGAIVPASTPCRHCGGWNLVTLGIAAQGVEDELATLFPDTSLFALTADSAPTHAKAKRIRDAFFAKAGTLMVGTDRALPYLAEVERTVVASVDSMLSLSAWRAHEHALHTLFALREKTIDEMIVQTRLPDSAVIRAVATGNPSEFIDYELHERKTFLYPPFASFIGLTWMGTEAAIGKIEEKVKEVLAPWELVGPLPARAAGKNRYLARAVIRLAKGGWPDDALAAALATLPTDVAISIDPDDIV